MLAGEITRSGVVSALLLAIDDAGGVEWSIEVDAGSGSTHPAIAALTRRRPATSSPSGRWTTPIWRIPPCHRSIGRTR